MVELAHPSASFSRRALTELLAGAVNGSQTQITQSHTAQNPIPRWGQMVEWMESL
jgi:hypothetical protein